MGSALCSFFLLLVSLSEHLPFGASYAVAASACVLLQLEQTALVVGAIALFLVLTAVMVLTRKVNWYGLSQSGGTPGRPMPPKPPSTPPTSPMPPTPAAPAVPATPARTVTPRAEAA